MDKRNTTKRRMVFALVFILIVAWTLRVVYVNRAYDEDMVYLHLSDTIDCSDYKMIPVEARLFTLGEYEDYFGVHVKKGNTQGDSKEDKIIGLKLHIVNTSDKTLAWSEVLSEIGIGFESLTWCSVSNPWLGKEINILHDESFKAGAEIDYWIVTRISRISFGKESWRNLKIEDFMFLLQLYAQPVCIIFR